MPSARSGTLYSGVSRSVFLGIMTAKTITPFLKSDDRHSIEEAPGRVNLRERARVLRVPGTAPDLTVRCCETSNKHVFTSQ